MTSVFGETAAESDAVSPRNLPLVSGQAPPQLASTSPPPSSSAVPFSPVITFATTTDAAPTHEQSPDPSISRQATHSRRLEVQIRKGASPSSIQRGVSRGFAPSPSPPKADDGTASAEDGEKRGSENDSDAETVMAFEPTVDIASASSESFFYEVVERLGYGDRTVVSAVELFKLAKAVKNNYRGDFRLIHSDSDGGNKGEGASDFRSTVVPHSILRDLRANINSSAKRRRSLANLAKEKMEEMKKSAPTFAQRVRGAFAGTKQGSGKSREPSKLNLMLKSPSLHLLIFRGMTSSSSVLPHDLDDLSDDQNRSDSSGRSTSSNRSGRGGGFFVNKRTVGVDKSSKRSNADLVEERKMKLNERTTKARGAPQGPTSNSDDTSLSNADPTGPSTFLSSQLQEPVNYSFGFCESHLHASPNHLSDLFLDLSSDLFLFECGAAFAASAMSGGGLAHRAASATADEYTFLPCKLGAKDKDGVCFVRYARVPEEADAVVELLQKMSRAKIDEKGGGAAILFTNLDESQLDHDGQQLLQEMRRNTMQKYEVYTGREVGYMMLEPMRHGCSKVSLVVKATYDVESMTETSRNWLLHHTFISLKTAQKKYERCDDIDDLARRHFVDFTMKTAPPLCAVEEKFLSQSLSYLRSPSVSDGAPFARVAGSLSKHPSISMFSRTNAKGEAWGSAVARLDASSETAVAWMWEFCAYNRKQGHLDSNGGVLVPRTETVIPHTRSKLTSVVRKMVKGIEDRIFNLWWVWDRQVVKFEGGGQEYVHVLAFAPKEECEINLPSSATFSLQREGAVKKYVQATARGIYKFTPIAAQLCEMSLVQNHNAGGTVPTWVSTLLIVRGFDNALKIQEYFKRVDRDVDKEMRLVTASKIRSFPFGVQPTDASLYKNCESLGAEFEDQDHSHVLLRSTSPFVEFAKKIAHVEKSKSILATGKATTVVDCQLEEAAAWIFDYCSRERMRINVEKGNAPRFIVRSNAPNNVVLASVKNSPFPFAPREHIVNMSWIRMSEHRVVVCSESTREHDSEIDYGASAERYVRATTIVWYVFDRIQNSLSCSLRYYAKVNLNGKFPEWILNTQIPRALVLVTDFRDTFQRDDEIDVEARDSFQKSIKHREVEGVDPNEVSDVDAAMTMINQSVTKSTFGLKVYDTAHHALADPFLTINICRYRDYRGEMKKIGTSSLHRLEHRVSHRITNRVNGFSRQRGRRSTAGTSWVGLTAEMVVDASPQECAAWEFLKCQRQRVQFKFDRTGAVQSETIISHIRRETTETYLIADMSGTLRKRTRRFQHMWRREIDAAAVENYVVSEQQLVDEDEPKKKLNDNVLSRLSETRFSEAPHSAEYIAQTTVFMTLKLSLNELLTLPVEEGLVSSVMSQFSTMRRCFDKSVLVDEENRVMFISRMLEGGDAYSDEENQKLQKGQLLMRGFTRLKKRKTLPSTSPLTKCAIAHVEDGNSAWGLARTNVCAPLEHVLAYCWDTNARNQLRADIISRAYVEELNSHNRVERVAKRLPQPFKPRDFCFRALWKQEREDYALLVANSTEHPLAPRDPRYVRMDYTSTIEVAKQGACSELFFLTQIDHMRGIPHILSKLLVSFNLRQATIAQQYFQQLRKLAEYDENDGNAIGEAFMIKPGYMQKRIGEHLKLKERLSLDWHISMVVEDHVGLKEFAKFYPWFPSLVCGMVRKTLRDPANVTTKLDYLTKKEAYVIGRSFAAILFDRRTALDGADMFVCEYPSLLELRGRFPFFFNTVVAIARRQLLRAPWGLWLQVGIGAFLSTLDVFTDVYAVVMFKNKRNDGFALAVIATIFVSMITQLLIVYVQSRKKGARAVSKEVIIVLTGFKPAIDAFRVVRGGDDEDDDRMAVDPMFELIMSKIAEVVAEAIPNAVLQTYAYLMTPQPTSLALASIAISVCTIAYSTSVINFDFDLNPESRLGSPNFYGYIPSNSGKRFILFVTMVFFTTSYIIVKVVGVSILLVVSPVYFIAILGGDLFLYLVLKAARNDFRYWFKLDGVMAWILSAVVRLFVKICVDFTTLVQARHPNEVGGVMWVFALAVNQITSFFAVYLLSICGHNQIVVYSEASLWTFLSLCDLLFFLFFLIFLLSIKRKYISTFFTTHSAKEYCVLRFREATSPQFKMDIFKKHRSFYEPIREEVKSWIEENWSTWMEERPAWFTAKVKSRVPLELLGGVKGPVEARKSNSLRQRLRNSVMTFTGNPN